MRPARPAGAGSSGREARPSRAALVTALALSCAALSCVEPEADPGSIRLDDPRDALDRPDTPGTGLQFHFDAGDDVETYASPGGRFLVHFTRSGDHAVDPGDDDDSGVPDFVEQVGDTYDEVLTFYEGLGFLAPRGDGDVADGGGDDRFDVYLVDFGGVGDGTFRVDSCEDGAPDRCAGFMTQENDFAGYGYPSTRVANRILASHEFFHAVQAAYDRGQGSVLAEGSAVWATEQFDPSLDDFEAFLPGYFENVDRPLDEPLPGPVDPFSYGSAIFFQFVTEAYGDTVVRALWESLIDGAGGLDDPQWMSTVDGVLQAEAGVTFAEAFTEFSRWNLYTDAFADPSTSYENGGDYPRAKIEQESPPYVDESARIYYASASYVAINPGVRPEVTAAVVAPGDDPTAADDIALLIAVESGGAITSIEPADPSAGTETVAVTASDRVVVVMVDTRTSGSSKKPGLCIGDLEEVASCKAAIEASGTGSGGGAATSSGETSAAASTGSPASASGAGGGSGSGGNSGGERDAEDDGCGCSVPGGAVAPSRGWIAALFGAGYAVRRRRRRQTSATAAS